MFKDTINFVKTAQKLTYAIIFERLRRNTQLDGNSWYFRLVCSNSSISADKPRYTYGKVFGQ